MLRMFPAYSKHVRAPEEWVFSERANPFYRTKLSLPNRVESHRSVALGDAGDLPKSEKLSKPMAQRFSPTSKKCLERGVEKKKDHKDCV